MKVDIGIFAHNEAKNIDRLIRAIDRQSILDSNLVRVFVLSNGSTDGTAAAARQSIANHCRKPELIDVVDLSLSGKSRTWNTFVHEISRPDADQLIFCDADITMPDDTLLECLSTFLADRNDLACATSRPVKDLVYDRNEHLSLSARLIAKSGGALDDWRTSICGQLYALKTDAARSIHLPIGLPVEDGFVRAMVLTRTFSQPEDLTLIDGVPEYFHTYPSERKIGALIRHQTRLIIGSAINAAVFSHLAAGERGGTAANLHEAASDETWLKRVLAEQLPRWPFGWVPTQFLAKRIRNFGRTGRSSINVRSIALLVVGVSFDAIVYLNAQIRMARGTGAGYW